MATPQSLLELYTDELKDMWSANDQAARVLRKIQSKATNDDLKQLLTEAPDGIDEHTALLKELIESHDEKLQKEHCKGMEGLCAEAVKHTMEEAPESGPLLDAAIIAQYQRISHYGLAGFGTAAALAQALGFDDDAQRLQDAVAEIYDTDEMLSEIAEEAVNREAAEE